MEKRFATIMHEIRNPLGVINLHAELIRKNPDHAAFSAEVISRTSRELEKTLSELINLSKPITLEKTEEYPVEVIKETLSLIRPSFVDKNVGLTFKNNLSNELTVNIDRTKVHRVLFNLLKNALEASSPMDKVGILLENRENDVFIKISDHGAGVSVQNRGNIFNPFFTTKQQGTGLGLAESRRIIEAHGGSLNISPELEKGTTFIIQLKGSKNGHTGKAEHGNSLSGYGWAG